MIKTKLRYLWILVNKTEGLGWRIWKVPPLDWTRSEREDIAQKFDNIRYESHCVSFEKPVEPLANCRAENVINGYSRYLDENEYCWVSDETGGLPQWICLSLPKPTQVNSVHITFDTDMTNNALLRPIVKLPSQVATDYIIEAETENGWYEVARVQENFLRKRVHRFNTLVAKKIKITVTGSGDAKTARIYEVRLYNEP